MSSTFGHSLRISVFGQSHSPAIGVTIDGLPAGLKVDMEEVSAFLARRAPGQGAYATARKESDAPEVLSGLVDGFTCGAPLCAVIHNKDTRSKDYEAMRQLPRPSHADYAAYVKYGQYHDIRGGGHFSGRLTAPLCFAGAVAMQFLRQKGILVGAHISSIEEVEDTPFSPLDLTEEELLTPSRRSFPVLSEEAGEKMLSLIAQVKSEGDSIGGTIQGAAIGLPPGLGEPMFQGVENLLAGALFAIPAMRGPKKTGCAPAPTVTAACWGASPRGCPCSSAAPSSPPPPSPFPRRRCGCPAVRIPSASKAATIPASSPGRCPVWRR